MRTALTPCLALIVSLSVLFFVYGVIVWVNYRDLFLDPNPRVHARVVGAFYGSGILRLPIILLYYIVSAWVLAIPECYFWNRRANRMRRSGITCEDAEVEMSTEDDMVWPPPPKTGKLTEKMHTLDRHLPALFLWAVLLTACAVPRVSADPTPVRHYVPGASPANPTDALTFDPGSGPPAPQLVPGRKLGEKAARLDQGALVGDPFPIARAFTVEMWCRSFGPGHLRGNSDTPNGMLIAVGDGYWHGWRLTVGYPEARVGFEIGRPQPSSSVGIAGGALATGAWQHVAASWDGHTMRLYVNGLPVASGPYDGVYTAPADGQLRLGFANAGVGSLKLDVTDVTAYDQALDPLAIFVAATDVPLPDRFRDAFRRALDAQGRGDTAATLADFRSLTLQVGLPPAYQAAARLGLAQALTERQPAQAAREYATLVEGADVPDVSRQAAVSALLNLFGRGEAGGLPPRVFERLLAMPDAAPAQRSAALFGYARTLRQAGAYPQSRAQYDRLLALPGLTDQDRRDASLERVKVLAEGGDLNAAHEAAHTFVRAPGVPGYYGSLALLAVAEGAAQARQFSLARNVYQEVMALPDVPPSHADEARAGLKQVGRLAKGLPAEDLADSRVQLPPAPAPAVRLYVAPNGKDTNAGASGEPFATLARARDALRTRRPLPIGGALVTVRGGEYHASESFALTSEDGGTALAPVVYVAAKGETPIFTGAAKLGAFAPVQDPDVLARLPAEARGHVLQTDLRAAGVTDFGLMRPHGYGQKAVPIPELFYDGRPMTLARWPNTGFVLTGPVTDAGAEGPAGHGMAFGYEGDRPARWANAPDAWLYGYWYWDWADAAVPVASVDPATHSLRTTAMPPMGIRAGQRFYAFNLLEELDAPGEWYLDRQKGLLYFYPPGNVQTADVRFSVLETPLITVTDASYVTLRGLTLEGGRGTGVTVTGGDHCLLAGCTVRRLGGDAVTISDSPGSGVLGCDLYTLGRGGVRIVGGDRKTLTPGGLFVENCDIHDFSRLDRTYTPAVQIEGVGNRITHCHMHDAPHSAIRLEGNDHVIAFNEVDHVVTEADDQGGFDEWFNPTYRGNVLRDNFWHDIGSGLKAVGQAGIRLDDAISGTLITGNVFLRCSGGNFGGIQMNGGKENVIDYNLFVDLPIGISCGYWGEDHWQKFLLQTDVIAATTQTVDIRQPPYSTRYPALAHLSENSGVNAIWRNTFVNVSKALSGDVGRQQTAGNVATSGSASDLPKIAASASIPLAAMGLYPSADRAH